MTNNKIILGDEVLMDLTDDTVTEDTLLEGETAHDASGNKITGRAKSGSSEWSEINNKPFESIDNDTIVSEDGVLKATQYIEDVSSEFSVVNKKLNLSYATESKLAEIENKADASTTLSGYGITDAYTKDEVYAKSETYTKGETESLVNSAKVNVDTALSDTSTNPVQNKVVTKAISDIEDTIEENADWLKSKNLIDKNNLIYGYSLGSTGNLVAYGTAYVTDFIEVEEGKSYIGSGLSSSNWCLYNANKEFVRWSGRSSFTVASGEKYARADSLNTSLYPQLEEGSSASAYTPYTLSNVELTKKVEPLGQVYKIGVPTSKDYSANEIVGTITVPKGVYLIITKAGADTNKVGCVVDNGSALNTYFRVGNVDSQIQFKVDQALYMYADARYYELVAIRIG